MTKRVRRDRSAVHRLPGHGGRLRHRKGDPSGAAGNGAIVGATLGACIGYVAGGVLGRLLDLAMGAAERGIDHAPAHRLLAGGVGSVVLGGLSGVVVLPAAFVFPPQVGWSVVRRRPRPSPPRAPRSRAARGAARPPRPVGPGPRRRGAEHDDPDVRLVVLARRLGAGLPHAGRRPPARRRAAGRALPEPAAPHGRPASRVPARGAGPHPDHPGGPRAGPGGGFLEDGTRVVVGGAALLVGTEVNERITSKVETSVGRMLFASMSTET